jgi:hypothetical protein
MQKLTITIALAVIALALGTTTITTTTMQIQPAYSQPFHCATVDRVITSCITPGKDASSTRCDPIRGCTDPIPIDPQQAGKAIGGNQKFCAQRTDVECSVTKELPTGGPE